jgi:hypothetical protein
MPNLTIEDLRALLPKKKGKRPEQVMQAEIIRWYRSQYPEPHPMYYLLVSNDNNAISAQQGMKAKAQGRVAGVADLTFYKPGGQPILIELKTPTGRQSPDQKIWQKAIENARYSYVIVRSLEEFKKIIIE